MNFRVRTQRWLNWSLRYWGVTMSITVVITGLYFRILAMPVYSQADDCHRIGMSSCEAATFSSVAVLGDVIEKPTLPITDYAHYLTYKIVFAGELSSSTDTVLFISAVAETLSDQRGWTRAEYVFSRVEVASNADFTISLIQAILLDSIPGCDSNWSCRNGNNVYINEDRWNGATAAWVSAGGNLRDYRHMVVNHEVGHWLGLGHYNCSYGENGLAPVMQQQSIDLEGCSFNPWPLQWEIDSV